MKIENIPCTFFVLDCRLKYTKAPFIMDCSPRRRCDFGKPNSPFGEMVSVGVFGSEVEVVRLTKYFWIYSGFLYFFEAFVEQFSSSSVAF